MLLTTAPTTPTCSTTRHVSWGAIAITCFRVVAALAAAAAALYAAYLLVIGERWVGISAAPLGEPPDSTHITRVEYRPYPLAIVPLLAAGLALVGLARRRLALAWTGATVLLLFGGLTIFSVGLLVLAGLLGNLADQSAAPAMAQAYVAALAAVSRYPLTQAERRVLAGRLVS